MAGGVITAGVLGLLSKMFGGVSELRKAQSDITGQAIASIEHMADSDKAVFAASKGALEAVYKNGGWLERGWRPAFMWVIMVLIVARWFGYIPPGIDASEVDHIYTFMYIGLGGYIPLRSLDKWMMGFQVGSILKEFIRKKL